VLVDVVSMLFGGVMYDVVGGGGVVIGVICVAVGIGVGGVSGGMVVAVVRVGCVDGVVGVCVGGVATYDVVDGTGDVDCVGVVSLCVCMMLLSLMWLALPLL